MSKKEETELQRAIREFTTLRDETKVVLNHPDLAGDRRAITRAIYQGYLRVVNELLTYQEAKDGPKSRIITLGD